MANPYDDPRYQLARLKASQGGGVSFGRSVGSAPGRLPAEIVQRQQTSGGGSGLGASALQGVLSGLEKIALPGKIVVAGLEQAANSLDGDPATKVSWSDFKKNISDKEYGFGKAFNPNTGMIWLDRLIGFAGDVATDPLTYMTFGAGHFAGYSGRLALAGKVLETTGDNALAASAARLGRAALSAEDLSRLGLNKSGVYFFGKKLPAVRVPFSEGVGMRAERALAKFRIATSETRLGQTLQGKFMNKSLHEARLRLARGLASPEEAAGIIKLLNWENTARAISGETLRNTTTRLANTLEQEAPKGFEVYRGSLYRVIEEPAVAAMATADEVRAAEVWKNFLKTLYDEVDTVAQQIDPALKFGFVRDGYIPRVLSEDAFKYINDLNNPHANDLFKQFVKDGAIDEGGAFKTRGLVEKSKFFGKTLEKDDLTVSRLNQIAREAGFQGNFFETDIQKLMTSYVEDYSKQIATLSRYKYLKDAGVINFGRDAEWESTFVDSMAVDDARKLVRESVEGVAQSLKDKKSAIEDLVKQLEKVSKEMEASIPKMESGLADLGVRRLAVTEMEDKFNLLSAQLSDAMARLSEMQDSFGRMFYGHDNPWLRANVVDTLGLTPEDFNMDAVIKALGAEDAADPLVKQFMEMFGTAGAKWIKSEGLPAASGPVLIQNLFDTIDNLKLRIQNLDLDNKASKAFADLANGIVGDQQSIVDNLVKELTDATSQLDILEKQFVTAISSGQMVEENIAKAIKGIVFKDDVPGADVYNAIRSIAGASGLDPSVRAKMLMNFPDSGMYTFESFRDWFAKELASNSDAAKLWNEIAVTVWEQTSKKGERVAYGGAKLLQERSFAMSYEDFSRALIEGMSHDATLRNARELAAHLIMRDMRIYGSLDKMPDGVRDRLLRLVEVAKRASQVDSDIEKSLVQKAQIKSVTMFDDKWDGIVEEATTEIDRFTSVDSAWSKINKKINDSERWAKREFDVIDGVDVPRTAEQIAEDVRIARINADSRYPSQIIQELEQDVFVAQTLDGMRAMGMDIDTWGLYELRDAMLKIRDEHFRQIDTPKYLNPSRAKNLEKDFEALQKLKKELGDLTQRKYRMIDASEEVVKMGQVKKMFGGASIEDDLASIENEINRVKAEILKRETAIGGTNETIKLTARQTIIKYQNQREKLINAFSGSRAKRLLRLRKGAEYGQQIKNELLDEVMRYNLVSEVHATMDTLSRLMLPLGNIPTEKMYNDVVRNVAKKYLDSAYRYRDDIEIAESALTSMRQLFSERMRGAVDTETPGSVSSIFREVVDSVMQGEATNSAVNRILGPRLTGDDPQMLIDGYMRMKTRNFKALSETDESVASITAWLQEKHPDWLKKMREYRNLPESKNKNWTPAAMMRRRYEEEVLIPWFKRAYPDETTGMSAGKIIETLKGISGERIGRRGRTTQVALTVEDVARQAENAAVKKAALVEPGKVTEAYKVTSATEKVAKVRGRKSAIGPFHPMASESDVYNFLDSLLTTQTTMSRATYNRAGTAEAGISALSIGVLDTAKARARQQVSALERLVDPFTDVYKWLENPVGSFRTTTASGYIDWLNSIADQLEGDAARIPGRYKDKEGLLSRALQLDAEAERVQKQIDGMAVEYGPDMTEPEFVFNKASKEYKARRAARIDAYKKLTSSPEYLKAMKDRETVDVLVALAELDLSVNNFRNGFRTVDAGKVDSLMKTTSLHSQRVENLKTTIEGLKNELDENLILRTEERAAIAEQITANEEELARLQDEYQMIGTPDDLSGFAVIERKNPDGTIVKEAITFSDAEWRALYNVPGTYDKPAASIRRATNTLKTLDDSISETQKEISRLELFVAKNEKEATNIRDRRRAVVREKYDTEQKIANLRKSKLQIEYQFSTRTVGPDEARRLNATLASLDSQIASGEARLKTLKGMVTKGDKRLAKVGYGESVAVKRQIMELKSQIAQMKQKADVQRAFIASLDPQVRASALEKMDILVHGRNGQLPVFTKDSLQTFIDKAKSIDKTINLDSGLVTVRRNAIKEAFDSTPESAVIARANTMHDAYYLEEYFQMLKNKDTLVANAQTARKSASDVEIEIQDIITKGNDSRESAEKVLNRIISAMESRGFTVPPSLKDPLSEDFKTAMNQLRTRAKDVEKSIKEGTPGASTSAVPGFREGVEAEYKAAKPQLVERKLSLEEQRVQAQGTIDSALAMGNKQVEIQKANNALRTEAKKRLAVLSKLTDDAYKKRWERLFKSVEGARKDVAKLTKAADDAADNVARQYDSIFTLEEALYGPTDRVGGIPNLIEEMKSTRKQIGDVLSSLPAGWKDVLKTKGITDTKTGMWVDIFKWVEANREFFGKLTAGDLEDPVNQAVSRAFEAEGRFLIESMRGQHAKFRLDSLSEGIVQNNILKPWEDGYEKMAKKLGLNKGQKSLAELGMPSLYGNSEFVTTLENIGRIRSSAVANELSRFMSGYTRFFKAYATATPGFHLRNAISNTFQMFAGGADVANMTEGLKLWGSFREALMSSDERAIEKWLAWIPQEQRAQAEIAKNVYFALGGGRTEEALSEFVKKGGSTLVDNPVLNLSRKTGQRIEGSARFIFAFDSAKKGMEFNDSFARVKRYLFDYNDPTVMDEAVRGIIPFWTWMSRNLPLQLVNRFSNPKAYLIYNRFALNIAGQPIPNMPEWMQQGGAIPIGGSNVFMPDLPQNAAEDVLRNISKPSTLLSYVNPGVRAPLEFFAGKKFFTGQNFSDRYYKVTGANKAVIPLLAAMGQLEYNQQGEAVASEKGMYMLTSLIPTLGQANRLFPPVDGGFSGYAAMNWAGIPIRQVTPQMQRSTVMARKRQKQSEKSKRLNIERAQ